ncbi:hypothetical protein OIU76_026552 [Salix suchowensis]|nr:hypothetical protein OIU76_026552 [Salix suchowensis]
MEKWKAKKKSPSSSSRPPPPFPSSSMVLGPSPPTKKQLLGPNWLPELGSDPMSPELAAAVSQQLSPQLLASEGSPTFSELFAPVAMDSPRDSDYDGSSAYNLDSSSHYGSPVLANLELKARISSPASSAPAAAEGPSEIPAASHSAAMDSAPMLQAVLVSAQGHVPGPSDQVPAIDSNAPAPSSPPSGQWRNLFSSNRSSSSCPKLQHFVDISAAKTFDLVEDDIDIACDFWKLCLIGYVSGKFPGVTALRNIISSSWNCVAKMQIHESGWIVYKFQSELEKMNVLRGGPYLVYGRPLMLREMPEYFDFNSTDMTTLPVWIKLPNLSLKCWSTTCLSKIASALGKPVQSDMLTSSMTRLSYARILVEINLAEDLPQFVKFRLPNGVMHAQPIVYETLPKFCAHCKVIGHIVDSCSKASKKVGGGNSPVNAAAVPRNSTLAEKDMLSSEGAVSLQNSVDLSASLVDVGLQDNASLVTGMAFEAPAPAVAQARQPVPAKQPAPMISKASTADRDWQPVQKKHTSNRQPKTGLGALAGLVLGAVSVVSKGTAVETARNESVDNGSDLEALTLRKGKSVVEVGSAGPLVDVDPQASGDADLGPGSKPGSKGVLGGAPLALQRVNGRARPLKAFGQRGHTGKVLQSNSQLSRGHGRNLPTTTAP